MRENYQLIVVVVCQIAKLHVIATVIGVYESHALHLACSFHGHQWLAYRSTAIGVIEVEFIGVPFLGSHNQVIEWSTTTQGWIPELVSHKVDSLTSRDTFKASLLSLPCHHP